jgi:hypothetical protein
LQRTRWEKTREGGRRRDFDPVQKKEAFAKTIYIEVNPFQHSALITTNN